MKGRLLIPVLLFTFGLMLCGVDTGYLNNGTKVQDSVCPPKTVCEHKELPPPSPNGECDVGFIGTFPDCIKVEEQKCRRPEIGTFPNCFIPPCPPGYSRIYPKCTRTPSQPVCPFGSTGMFPDCKLLTKNCQGSMCDAILLPSKKPQEPSSSTKHPVSAVDEMAWEKFKQMFNKTYANEMQEEQRQEIFFRNRDLVESHNKLYEQSLETYSLAINAFSDRTFDEYLRGNGAGLSESAINQKVVKDSVTKSDDNSHQNTSERSAGGN